MPAAQIARRRLLQLGVGSGAAFALCGFPFSGVSAADDDEGEEVALAKLPAKVRAAADKAVTGAKWTMAYRYKDEDEVYYLVEGSDSKKRAVSVMLSPEGAVEEVETEIPLKDVPAKVRDAVRARYPRFKARYAYEIAVEGKVESYDLEGRRPRDKQNIYVSVSADGKTVEIEE